MRDPWTDYWHYEQDADAGPARAPLDGCEERSARRDGREEAAGREPPGKDRGNEEGKTGLVTKTRPKTKKPSLYKVCC